jgi:hypothetical protein
MSQSTTSPDYRKADEYLVSHYDELDRYCRKRLDQDRNEHAQRDIGDAIAYTWRDFRVCGRLDMAALLHCARYGCKAVRCRRRYAGGKWGQYAGSRGGFSVSTKQVGPCGCGKEDPVASEDTRVLDDDALNAILDKLPAKLRKTAVLLSQGLSHREIARKHGVSKSCISHQVNRIRRILSR